MARIARLVRPAL